MRPTRLTPEQMRHAHHLSDIISTRMYDKYEAGAVEHGGNLWEKEGLLDMALDEVIDLGVYLITLKEKLKKEGLTTP